MKYKLYKKRVIFVGYFSWTRTEYTTERANLTVENQYKALIPEEFGGRCIKDVYYGKIKRKLKKQKKRMATNKYHIDNW